MINIVATNGTTIAIDPATIARVRPTYEHDTDGATIVDYESQALHTTEDWQALVGRIGTAAPLVRLTRPDGSPVWVNKGMVNGIRLPVPGEGQVAARAFFLVGGLKQFVRETVAEVRAAISV